MFNISKEILLENDLSKENELQEIKIKQNQILTKLQRIENNFSNINYVIRELKEILININKNSSKDVTTKKESENKVIKPLLKPSFNSIKQNKEVTIKASEHLKEYLKSK